MDEEYLGDLAQGATARVMADLSISEHHRGVSSTVAGCLNYDAHSVCVEQLLCFLGYDETAECRLWYQSVSCTAHRERSSFSLVYLICFNSFRAVCYTLGILVPLCL